MTASDDPEPTPPWPSTYPDPEVVPWMRTDDIEFCGLHIRMTIEPGDRIVKLWALERGHPVRWLANAFRLEAVTPCLRLSCKYEQAIPRRSRDVLAATAAAFWKS